MITVTTKPTSSNHIWRNHSFTKDENSTYVITWWLLLLMESSKVIGTTSAISEPHLFSIQLNMDLPLFIWQMMQFRNICLSMENTRRVIKLVISNFRNTWIKNMVGNTISMSRSTQRWRKLLLIPSKRALLW